MESQWAGFLLCQDSKKCWNLCGNPRDLSSDIKLQRVVGAQWRARRLWFYNGWTHRAGYLYEENQKTWFLLMVELPAQMDSSLSGREYRLYSWNNVQGSWAHCGEAYSWYPLIAVLSVLQSSKHRVRNLFIWWQDCQECFCLLRAMQLGYYNRICRNAD